MLLLTQIQVENPCPNKIRIKFWSPPFTVRFCKRKQMCVIPNRKRETDRQTEKRDLLHPKSSVWSQRRGGVLCDRVSIDLRESRNLHTSSCPLSDEAACKNSFMLVNC